ncbi:MAG: hypothetical protein ABIP93_09680 [Gemmatimonadaceae bacterium]
MAEPIRIVARRTPTARASRATVLALLLSCATALAAPASVHAQAAAAGKQPKAGKPPKEAKPLGEKKVPTLFRSDSLLTLTLTTNIKQIRRDKNETPPWRWASLTYQDSASKPAQVPLRIRTRGFWRLKNCTFPPIKLNFVGKETKNSLFDDLEEPKLVNYCRDTDTFEQYILQEIQLYRIYQLLTPVSHRVRLAKVSYVDSASGKREAERYAIFVEDPEQLANRHSATLMKVKGAGLGDLDNPQLTLAYMFQYFIGNLDFSFSGLHNTELLGGIDGRILPVAYDFDFSGAVNTSYATPPEAYGVKSVRQRKFLASCALAEHFPAAVARLQEKKEAIYALYGDEIGKRMDQGTVRATLGYFDNFYEDVRTPESAKRNVFNYCIKTN